MNIKEKETGLWVVIAILWLAIVVLGTTGYYVIGMCLSVVLMFLHLLLGASRNGRVSKKFLVYPMVFWAILWIASFLLSSHYGNMFADAMPAKTFLGLHPSFAPTVFMYWIGGQLTINLGLYLRQDEWLPESEWNEFCEKAKLLRK